MPLVLKMKDPLRKVTLLNSKEYLKVRYLIANESVTEENLNIMKEKNILIGNFNFNNVKRENK